ncbi:substrate-binding domain-containing protein [Desulfosediminicola ganghwensis]|uniref:substrate-binding domain-containing protein n=1 Tax=Desulfosediminicola ganghwensis TaxID=2569540 RepID=UPI0010AD86BE|nr:substrate-binding domain-containing protein [Desulfosediminicola ganghwensis]
MLRKIFTVASVAIMALAFAGNGFSSDKVLKMSTTTSTQSSGLLDVLLPELEKDTGIKIKVIAKGTGAAIRDGQDGNVDVIFVHAKGRELKFVEEGYGTERYAVMHNDFVLIGPAADKAGVKATKSTADALKAIAAAEAQFISRGDDSGTHTKEQNLWKESGLAMGSETMTITKKGKNVDITFSRPENSAAWYTSIGQGMGKTITFADEKQAYTLSDRGTYIKYKYGKTPAIELDVLSEGDEALANPYGVIPVNPKKYAHVQYDMAMEFVNWITGPRGQKLIADYRLEGKQLFYPDAIK